MRLPDLWTGLGFALLGGFVALRATTFPEPAGAASPRLFPYIIGGAILLFGLLIAARSVVARMNGAPVSFMPRAEGWMRDPRRILRIAMVPLTIVLYGLLAPQWGTLLVATPLVFLNALLWQERPLAALISALLICLGVSLFFTQVMRVPLPTGPFFGSWF